MPDEAGSLKLGVCSRILGGVRKAVRSYPGDSEHRAIRCIFMYHIRLSNQKHPSADCANYVRVMLCRGKCGRCGHCQWPESTLHDSPASNTSAACPERKRPCNFSRSRAHRRQSEAKQKHGGPVECRPHRRVPLTLHPPPRPRRPTLRRQHHLIMSFKPRPRTARSPARRPCLRRPLLPRRQR